ncbi:MFS general substrate transporter [Xylariaceae sp. FL0804]|nr:MFS general substrate transporter [Xylariaceae sp. FL0804]
MADHTQEVAGGKAYDATAHDTAPLGSHADYETTVNEAKLLRKIDLRVLPILFAVYIVAFLDRVNISNALTLGLPEDLGLRGDQENVALTIFFVPYILFEIPSNIIMKRLGPRLWLSGCILCFGLIMIGQGFVRSYGGLLATRFFMGLAEAGIFPGSFYLISFWYRAAEAQKRFTVYWSSTLLAGAFGGLLASAIAHLDGVRGYHSWRWVFILEGIATCLVAFTAFFTIVDFPREARWLSPEERAFVIRKTGAEESHAVPVSARDVGVFLAQPKNWFGALMYFSILVPAYSIVYFLPTIIEVALGYGKIQTQLHSVVPFAAAFGFAMAMSILSDRVRLRSPFILLGLALLVAGLATLISVAPGPANFGAEYAALNLTGMGSFGIGGMIVCWYVMNLRGHAERGIGSAWMICVGNAGGLVATFLFLKKDAPGYHSGYSVCLGMAALCVASCAGYGFCIWRERRAVGTHAAAVDAKGRALPDITENRLYL